MGVLMEEITIDGDDATEAILKMAYQVKNHVQYILTDTITFGGFNIVDINYIFEKINKPIISITERQIDLDAVQKALINKYPHTYEQKLRKIIQAGNLFQMDIQTAGGFSKVYYHCKGIKASKVERLLKKVCIDSKLPEPVRIAHIIGKLFAKD
jgi:endonuclease V-like protein UPF0215 family